MDELPGAGDSLRWVWGRDKQAAKRKEGEALHKGQPAGDARSWGLSRVGGVQRICSTGQKSR